MSKPGDRASKLISSLGAGAFNCVVGHGASPENGRGDGAPPGVLGVRQVQKSFDRKLGPLEGASLLVVSGRQSREGEEPNAVMVEFESSDEAIVPGKSAKMRVTPFESMEGRAEAEGNSVARNAPSNAPIAAWRMRALSLSPASASAASSAASRATVAPRALVGGLRGSLVQAWSTSPPARVAPRAGGPLKSPSFSLETGACETPLPAVNVIKPSF